jgi:hypothetical protein
MCATQPKPHFSTTAGYKKHPQNPSNPFICDQQKPPLKTAGVTTKNRSFFKVASKEHSSGSVNPVFYRLKKY